MRSLRDYTAFLRRRWRFIACGWLAAVGVMGVVSASLADVYSAWVVIDTGTLGQQLPREVDAYRDRFNADGHRRVLTRVAPDTVSKVWLHAAPPLVMIRADARNGDAAAEAAREAGRLAVTELSLVPLPSDSQLPRSAAEVDVFRTRELVAPFLAHVETTVSESRETAHAAQQSAAVAAAQLARLARRSRSDRPDPEWRAAALELNRLVEVAVAEQHRAAALEQFRRQLHRAVSGAIPARAQEALQRAVQVDLHATDAVAAAGGELRDLLADVTAPPIDPVRVTIHPVVPGAPSWPQHGVNILIAAIFGLAGSVFAAALVERDAVPAVVERT